jgi:hypothetical protein
MGMCKYCGEKAGWFSDVHDSCVSAAKEGSEKIASLISSVLSSKLVPPSDHPTDEVWSREFAERVWAETKPQIGELASRQHVPSDELRSAMRSGWSTGAENVATAEPMHPDRLSLMNSFFRCMGFSDQEMRGTDGFITQVLSTLLWSVIVAGDPTLIANVPRHPFNLKPGEIPLMYFGSVVYSKETTDRRSQGGYGGMSVRVGHGVYYHFGGFRSQRADTTSLKEIDYGGALLTTQNMYFGGEHTNFRVPYEHVVTFRPESSGIAFFRDSANAKAELLTVLEANPNGGNPVNARPVFAWFLFNVAHFLAQPEARALYSRK